jgi:hypothetical protein
MPEQRGEPRFGPSLTDDADADHPLSAAGRRSVTAAYAMLLLGGWAGLHRLYTGRVYTGFLVLLAVAASAYASLISWALPDVFGFSVFGIPGSTATLWTASCIAAAVYAHDAVTLPSAVAAFNSPFEAPTPAPAISLGQAPRQAPAAPSWLVRFDHGLTRFGQAKAECQPEVAVTASKSVHSPLKDSPIA